MLIFVFCYVLILLVSFAVMMFMTREGHAESAIRRRLSGIGQPLPVLAGGLSKRALNPQDAPRFVWLEVFFADRSFMAELKRLIAQANSKAAASNILLSSGVLALITFAVVSFTTNMLVVAAGAALVSALIPVLALKVRRARRLHAFDDALPECIEMCSRALRAGHSLNSALGLLADQAREPAKSEFADLFMKQNYGLPLRDGIVQMLDRVPSTDLKVFATGVLVQKDTGGNLAELLDRTSIVIRERTRIQREIKTHTAQGRMTGWILCGLPFVMLLLLNVVSPGYSDVLIHNPLGRKLFYLGLALEAVGGLIIRQIINGIEV